VAASRMISIIGKKDAGKTTLVVASRPSWCGASSGS